MILFDQQLRTRARCHEVKTMSPATQLQVDRVTLFYSFAKSQSNQYESIKLVESISQSETEIVELHESNKI